MQNPRRQHSRAAQHESQMHAHSQRVAVLQTVFDFVEMCHVQTGRRGQPAAAVSRQTSRVALTDVRLFSRHSGQTMTRTQMTISILPLPLVSHLKG